MQSLECINFVKKNAPNILLIADKANNIQKGYYLKHFKNTHNIYAIFHNLNNYNYYQDIPSKHEYIKEQLDKHNLKTFTVSALSFGGLLAYYLIFHMPEKIERAFIYDYYFDYTDPIQSNLSNWHISPSSVQIVIYLTKLGFVKAKSINKLLALFPNIRFVPVNTPHNLRYKLTFKQNFWFYVFNGFSIKTFWNKYFNLWITNKYIFKPNNPLLLKYFAYKNKKNMY